MKKISTGILSLMFIFSCSIFPAFAANAPSNDINQHSPVTPKIFIQTDSDYKEITPKTNSTIITDLGDNEYQADCEVVVSLPDSGISPRSSQTSEADQDAIIARLTITYSLSSDKEKIKISAVSGSWTGSITNLEMKDRVVGVTDGAGYWGIGSKTLTWHPPANSFTYSTGWGYVDFLVPSDESYIGTGPRAYSEAYYRIPGMGGWDWHSIFLTVELSPV